MLALTSTTGKLGSATLSAILEHKLIPIDQFVVCTSSPADSPKFAALRSQGLALRQINYDAPSATAFADCTALFLVSTPDIALDFNFGKPDGGRGRETAHISVIEAALKAGVKHVYYTSLAFGSESGAGVMRAHLRTEEYLARLEQERGVKSTIVREGLYNSSWPLYLGYYGMLPDKSGSGKDVTNENRGVVVIAGDGQISWTSIEDLGLGTALILSSPTEKHAGKTLYLSSQIQKKTLAQVAGLVGKVKGQEVKTKVVSREEYVEYYVSQGLERPGVEWWSTTYGALDKEECNIEDDTLDTLLEGVDVKAKPVEDTIKEMLKA